MKVVFDSNVYVSALAIPGGVAEQALDLAMEGAFQLAISRPILTEVLGVLSRKFARAPEELSRMALYLSSVTEIVTPVRRVSLLECASAAGAGVIVTGDREMLSLGTWEGIEILSLRQFVDSFASGRAVHQEPARYRVSRRQGRAGGRVERRSP